MERQSLYPCQSTKYLFQQVCACPNGMELDYNKETCKPQLICKENEYKCSSGECIQRSLRCNGHKDCKFGDDEEHCIKSCPHGSFACANGRQCINHAGRCNNRPDCDDSSDEHNCDTHGVCSTRRFLFIYCIYFRSHRVSSYNSQWGISIMNTFQMNSTVERASVFQILLDVTRKMTAPMEVMKSTVRTQFATMETLDVLQATASLRHGSVIMKLTAWMDLMKATDVVGSCTTSLI